MRRNNHRTGTTLVLGLVVAGLTLFASYLGAQTLPPSAGGPTPPPKPVTIELRRFLVDGVTLLTRDEVTAATQPFLGADREMADVRRAREAIESAYRAKGYFGVQVTLAGQDLQKGEIRFRVVEPKSSQELRFEIRSFIVEGATLLSPAEVDAVTAPFVGPNRQFTDVQRALEAVEKAYSAKGYNAVQVLLLEQELDRGEVRFKVVEATIGKLTVEGNKFFDETNVRRSLPAVAPGTPPNVKRISANLRVLNENPAKQTTVLLRGSTEEAQVDAVARVTDEDPAKFSVTFDNTGTPQTGIFRIGVGFQHANVFNRDHVVSMQYVTAPHEPDDPNALAAPPDKRVTIFALAYRIPDYPRGNSLDLFGGYSNVNSGIVSVGGSSLSVSGSGTIFGLRYNVNLQRIADYDHRIALGYDWRAYTNRVTAAVGAPSLIPDVTVHPVSVTYIGVNRTASSEFSFNVGAFQNLPGGNDGGQTAFSGSEDGSIPPSRAGANAAYLLFRYGASYNKAFANDWQTRLAYNGQQTRDKLISGEQFGIGGADSVRGFYEREITNDNGYRGSVELYTPDYANKIGLSESRMRTLFFYDLGRVWRNEPLVSDPPQLWGQAIGSVGFGFRYSHSLNLALRLDFARVVDAGGTQAKGDERVHGSIVYIF
jgi:hemolysin activation/secretion protein